MPTAAPARGSRLRSTRVAAVVLTVLVSLLLAGCHSDKKSAASASKPQSQPVQGGKTLAAVWPLTGEPVNGSTPGRPVLVTKIDNSSASRPQVGLKHADLITEELVEGGITRLAVFYYQSLPPVAGPVRSMRASDIGIVKPAHAVIVASGAAPPTLARLRYNHITFFGGGGPGYYRDGSRIAPHNLMVRMPELAKSVRKKAIVPASYLPWGKESDFTSTTPATHLDAVFSRGSTTVWQFRGGKYYNTNSNAAQGDRFNPDSVLVLRVREGDAGYLDPAGNHVPETLYYGSGPALLFHNGKVERGTWTKKSRETPVRLTGAKGAVMKVPAGHVWIELLPNNHSGGRLVIRR
ncbi:MAG: DUF3048 domain-containing protein [Marmoricola sp.]|nr:DUF3048 domain-containing protein [Marmoricola sp.]